MDFSHIVLCVFIIKPKITAIKIGRVFNHVYYWPYYIVLGVGHLDERILELAISLSHQGYSPDKITWLMNFLLSLKVEKEKSTKQEELFFGNIPDLPQKFVPGLSRGWILILVEITKTNEEENETEKLNLYYLFMARIYLELHTDSKFLHEFAYLWTEARLKPN